MKSYTTLRNTFGTLSQVNTTQNLSLGDQLINDSQRYLLQKYWQNETSYTDSTVANQQGYNLPPNYSKLKDVTITIGQQKFTPNEILTRQEWDLINQIPQTADIPQYYFIYGGQMNFYPIPSSNGNTITYNYKMRVVDLSIADTSAGTVSVTQDSSTITGVGTGWQPTVSNDELRWIRIDFPKGDYQWYKVASVDSATQITLMMPYQGETVSAGSYTLGQMPLLLEDFQDLLLYRPLYIYYSSINKDPIKASNFKALYDEGVAPLDEYLNTKSVNVDLGQKIQLVNPNLFYYSP